MIGSTSQWTGWYCQYNTSSGYSFLSSRSNSFNGSVSLGLMPGIVAIACSCNGGTRLQAAINGTLGTADTSITNPQGGSDVFRLVIGGSAKDTIDNNLIGHCQGMFVWGRALTDAELVSVTSDPYQFLIPA
jgi:hypothetical protein